MIRINILSRTNDVFIHQWDKERFPESEYDIRFNCREDIIWDCVVVYQDILIDARLRCKEGNVIYVSGEPPMMVACPHEFTNQFDVVILPHKAVKHKCKITSHGFLNWSLGFGFKSKIHRYYYQDFLTMEPKKTKFISLVSSNQQMMPGHNRRMHLIQRLQKDYPDIVDIYGKGFNFVDYKADALLPYMFHICIENSNIDDYWTEKISDPILAQCVPIYAGCTNIEKYLGHEGYITFDVNDYESLKAIIEHLKSNPESEYYKRKPMLNNLRKIIMERENLIPYIIEYIKRNQGDVVKSYSIHDLKSSKGFYIAQWMLRLRRFLYKQYFKLTHA